MQKRYELWLDESGDFKNQAQLKKQNRHPSLIGGILLEKHQAEKIDMDELIDDEHNHAMHFTDEQKRDFSLPVLERLKRDYGAIEVFFENQTYTDAASNRQLYLRIMAEGLLQLFQTLNAMWESVSIEVTIAQRQDVEADPGKRKIVDTEYQSALDETMKRKRYLRRILIDDKSKLEYAVQAAHTQKKLQAADFACNTRLTRHSKAFQECQERIEELYADALVFSLAETGTDNYIRRSLAQGAISDSIMELYTTPDKNFRREEMLQLIIARMEHVPYRILKSQMKHCSSEVLAYTAAQDDYEVAEGILVRIHDELIREMKRRGLFCERFEFDLLMSLADSYLREGDISAARRCIESCREVQNSLGNALEEILTCYQLAEKESLLAIDEFNYRKGMELMHEACQVFSGLMNVLTQHEVTRCRFPNMRSEYLGDALCMEIYAGMFLLREEPELYDELCRLSDLAMKQYPDEKGELERHRQYRSRIELEVGHYQRALEYLILAKEYEENEISEQTILKFLNHLSDTEYDISCQYYLMYYLLILYEARRAGEVKLSKLMYRVLLRQKRLLATGGVHQEQSSGMNEADTKLVKGKRSGVSYHPMEIIMWKYAGYLCLEGNYESAELYFIRAIKMCFAYDNYTTMEITGIGILAEYTARLGECGKIAAAREKCEELLEKTRHICRQKIQPETRAFVEKMEAGIREAKTEKGKPDVQKLLRVSEKIAY